MGIVMAACENRNCDYQIIDEYTSILDSFSVDNDGLAMSLSDASDVEIKQSPSHDFIKL